MPSVYEGSHVPRQVRLALYREANKEWEAKGWIFKLVCFKPIWVGDRHEQLVAEWKGWRGIRRQGKGQE